MTALTNQSTPSVTHATFPKTHSKNEADHPRRSLFSLASVSIGFSMAFGLLACSSSADSDRLIVDARKVAAVGEEAVLEVQLAEVTGQVDYSFSFDQDVFGDADIKVRNDGSGVFTFRPIGKDIGNLVLTVAATDGLGFAETTVDVEVRSTVGLASMPRFRRPLGEGTSLAVEQDDCVEVEVLIDDQDTADVEISQVAPLIEGATLQDDGAGAAVWRWCPTDAQRAERDRYVLTLGADDGENPQALKRYLVVFDTPGKLGCPGQLPSVKHTAEDSATLDSIRVIAGISDTEGLKAAPLVVLGEGRSAVQYTMILESGDSRNGQWAATLPNPVLDETIGTVRELAYTIVVEDNDGLGSDCDNQVKENFSIEVTKPNDGPVLDYCAPCESDLQCGGDKDLCLEAGVLGVASCAIACDDDSDCQTGSLCSPEDVESVNGRKGRQCIPENDLCIIERCADGTLEPNDSRTEAAPLSPGTVENLKICPIGHLAADEDWYELNLETDSDVDFGINADIYPNLDIRIFDDAGILVAASEDWGSTDSVSRCFPQGKYHARVYSAFAQESSYSLNFAPSPSACAVSECTADPFEDDDNADQARLPDFEGSLYQAGGNSICTGDQDWIKVYLFGDESIYGTLTFEQTLETEDLDFLVYDEAGNLLINCTADDASGCTQNGQSGDSNESFQFTATTAQFHYVVVNGFDGSENSYDICLSLTAGVCL